jgi:hypothetical protein
VSSIWWRKLIAALFGIVAFILLQKILKLAVVALKPPPLA